MIDIPAYLSYIWKLLITPNGILSVLGVAGIVWLWRLYGKKMEIPGLAAELIPEESWFIHRDDNHRLVIVISLRLTNKGGKEIRLVNAKFSGYSPKEQSLPVLLEGHDRSVPLPFPKHEQYFKGKEFGVAPFASKQIWLYYESGSVDTRHRLGAPLILRSADGKRTPVRVELTRHVQQLQLYREQSLGLV